MRRQKRKPDSIQLNFVTSNPKRKSISVKRVSFSLAQPSQGLEQSSTPVSSATQDASSTATCASTDTSHFDFDFDDLDSCESSSKQHDSHTLRKLKAVEAWNEIRPNLSRTQIEVSGFPSQPSYCVFCKGCDASVWCEDCGTCAYLCEECTVRLHSSINLFHNPLLWKDEEKMYMPFPRKSSIESSCGCGSTYHRDLTCVDKKGCYHCISVAFCSCEPEVTTLMRVHLFPATPKQPKLAFTFALLDWFEALMLECQVSAQDFVAAIGVLTDTQIMKDKRCNLYPVIIDSFEEYRYMKYKHRHLKDLIPDRYNDGTKCPACPKDGKVFYSIDGNFGLCRKRAAGSSVRPPLHQQTVFFNQKSIDEFVRTYGKIEIPLSKECNQFLAGDALRSKSRFKALDETGVIGIVCRHEVPFKLYSLCHGERISYIVYALERILDNSQHHSEVRILYDVACTLERHLHCQGRNDLLGYFQFAVPVFHSYGHKVDCQFKYNPRNLDGFGLTDGEVVERLWSYLRRFSKMTKEMRPSHRIDVLTDALLHYSQQSIKRLSRLLPSRIQKAMKIQQHSKYELEELMKNSPVQFSPSDIKQWYLEELHHSTQSSQPQAEEESWEKKYFSLLKIYYNMCDEVRLCTTNRLQAISQRIHRIDTELKAIEDKQHVQRWLKESDVFRDWEKMEEEKQRNSIIFDIETSARERWFLLNLKAKFADGQYLASRLSKSINKEAVKLKQLIEKLNALSGERVITWADATDLSSTLLCHGTHTGGIPRNIKLNAIKHHHLALRADEDINLLQNEMLSTFSFFVDDWKLLTSTIADLKSKPCSKYDNGALNQLQLECVRCEALLLDLRSSFSTFVDLPVLPVDKFITQLLSIPIIPPQDVLHTEDTGLGQVVDEVEDEPGTGCLPHTSRMCDDEDSSSDDDDHEHNTIKNSGSQPRSKSTYRPTRVATLQSSNEAEDNEPQTSKLPLVSHTILPPVSQSVCVRPKTLSHTISPDSSCTHESSDSDDNDSSQGEDFFPTKEEIQRRCLRFEREQFLKQQDQEPYQMSEKEKHVMTLMTEAPDPLGQRKHRRGFLHANKEELKKALESSRKGLALSRVISAGPHFIHKDYLKKKT